ncbi:MAG: S-layer homology domain-containing protein [Oscillospiraceae bacterium]|nr:S-layer homology domain-containing protein [Oscillospiraceae bacterium]
MVKKCKRLCLIALAAIMLLGMMVQPHHLSAADYGSTPFVPNPQTEYAHQFIALSDGEQWFMDVVESILNVYAMSINTIASRADLDRVISVGLFDAGITGTIPRAIGELRNLQFLHLGRNNFSGTIPEELFRCTRLVEVDLSQNNLTGYIPAEFGNLSNLRVLLLWGNEFSGAIPSSLGGLSGLVNLDLSSNSLTGGIPPSLGSLVSLRVLNLSDNPLGGELPPALGNLAELRVLSAWGCELDGELPFELGNLGNLVAMDLSQNNFFGEIPSSFSALISLQELALADNSFEGELPEILTDISAIRVLDLARNEFSGNIPAGYEALINLRAIDLDDNNLLGVIPDIWTEMDELETVWLRGNQFVGDVPESLLEPTDVRVNNNHLYGSYVAKLGENSGNFVHQPGARPQFRMSIDSYVWSPARERLNIFEIFRIVDTQTGEESAKEKLPVWMYEIVIVTEYGDIPSNWFEITSDENGIYIRLLRDVAINDALLFELRILPHDANSPYSFVRFYMGTEEGGVQTPPSTPRPSTPTPVPVSTTSPTPSPSVPTRPAATASPSIPPQFTGGVSVSPALPSRPEAEPEPPYELERRYAYVTGTSANLFEPNAPMKRVDIAVALFNIAGRPEVEINIPFSDINNNHPNIAAIAWVYTNRLMIGYPDGTFRPDASLTRGELATLIVNWRGYAPQPTTTFPDALRHWANGSIGAVEMRGHVTGYPDGNFRPNAPIRRSEVVTLLNSLIGRVADLDHVRYLENPYTDISPSHWAYAEILVAAVDHYVVILPFTSEEADER